MMKYYELKTTENNGKFTARHGRKIIAESSSLIDLESQLQGLAERHRVKFASGGERVYIL